MRKELRIALYEAVLAVRDGKGWPLSDRVPAKSPVALARTEEAQPLPRAGKIADQIRRLRDYAAKNPHVDVEAVIRQLERGR